MNLDGSSMDVLNMTWRMIPGTGTRMENKFSFIPPNPPFGGGRVPG
jgi:hypothetical protein